MRLIHISDTHISDSNATVIGRRVEALCAAAGTESVSAVIFTGDASASGQPEQFQLFQQRVVAPILKAFRLGPDRFLITPGNHDVTRTRVKPLLEAGVLERTKEPESADSLWADEDSRPLIRSRLEVFAEYCRAANLQNKSTVVTSDDGSAGAVCINSAWTSASDKDRHRLVITRAQFEESLGLLGPCAVRFGFWHHPLNWLEDKDAVRIQDAMLTHLDFACVGHFHEDAGHRIDSPFGNSFLFQAPALYARDSSAGFFALDLDPVRRKLQVRCYRWDDRRGVFNLNTDFAPGGCWSGDLPERTAASPRALAVRNRIVLAMRDRSKARMESRLPSVVCASGRLAAEDRFLQPHLVATAGAKRSTIAVAELLSSDRNVVLCGERNSGKSTLLDYLQLRLSHAGQVAVRLSFAEIGTAEGRPGLCSALARVLQEPQPQVERLLDAGMTLLIDDGRSSSNDPEWDVLGGWLESAPRARVILACGTVGGVPRALDRLSRHWRLVSIEPMPLAAIRKEMARIEKVLAPPQARWDLQRALDTMNEAELPRWPWVLLLFMELSNRGHGSDVTSLGALLRVYSELRLGAFDAKSSEAARVGLRMLRLLAAEMCKRGQDHLLREEAVQLVAAELANAGVGGEATATLDALVGSGLLTQDSGSVRFSFIVFQEYFHAEKMKESQWNGVAGLTADEVMRMSGALMFLVESVSLPGLVDKAFGLATESSPTAKPMRLEDLATLGELLKQAPPEEVIEEAKEAVPDGEAAEQALAEREAAQRGTRLRRLKNGRGGLEKLEAFREQLYVAIALLRGDMWGAKASKVQHVRKAVELARVMVSELAVNEEVLRFLSDSDELPTKRRVVADVINLILILTVGGMVAGVGGARHLASAIRDAFEVEVDELERLLLLFWYTEVDGADAEEVARSFVKGSTSLSATQICELWLTMRYVNAMTFGSATVQRQEDLLRHVATERGRRSRTGSGSDAKLSAEKVVQRARKLRLLIGRRSADTLSVESE